MSRTLLHRHTDGRLMLLIDPEDREHVVRLTHAWSAVTHAELDCADPMTLAQLRMREALRRLVEPPEVYEHYRLPGSGSKATALCGKVWTPGGIVSVGGRCPECTTIIEASWVA